MTHPNGKPLGHEVHYIVLTDWRDASGRYHTEATAHETEHAAWEDALETEGGEWSGASNPRIVVVEGNTARVIPNSEIADEALHRERMSCERETAWAQGY